MFSDNCKFLTIPYILRFTLTNVPVTVILTSISDHFNITVRFILMIWSLKSPRLRVSLPSALCKVASDHCDYSTGRGAWHGWVTMMSAATNQRSGAGILINQRPVNCRVHTSQGAAVCTDVQTVSEGAGASCVLTCCIWWDHPWHPSPASSPRGSDMCWWSQQ